MQQTGVLDLGEIEEPVLFFGGPCSNLQSTETLLSKTSQWGFSPDRIICTGDLVAYCADPQATVDLIRDSGVHVVLGNCEESLGNDSQDCGCGFTEQSSCDLLADQWYRFAQSQLDLNTRAWLKLRPPQIRLQMGGRNIVVVHGSFSRINEFVFPASDVSFKEQELNKANADAIVGGHCGVPFSQRIGDRLWHNAGIVGIPANDGRNNVWFSTFELKGDAVQVSHLALEYDFETAARRMQEAGLPEEYADTLRNGIWPSDEVMPENDRARRGVPIQDSSLVW